MPPRTARKRPLEQSEGPRPSKRVAAPSDCPLTSSHLASTTDSDKSVSNLKMSKVDIAVSRYLDEYCLERHQFDKLQPKTRTRILRDIFKTIVKRSGEKLNPNLHEMVEREEYDKEWTALVQAHPDLNDILLECWSLEPPSFTTVLDLDYLQKPKPQPETPKERLSRCRDHHVLVSSWSEEFRGDSAKLLHNTLRGYLKNDTGCIPYARYAALVQSSGTGKSRMNDELAKSIIYIPVNLEVWDRIAARIICPPPDNQEFQDWFWLKAPRNSNQQMSREHYEGFVFGLMTVTKNRLEEIEQSNETIPGKDNLAKASCIKTATLDRLSLLAKEFRTEISAMELNDLEDSVLQYREYRERFHTDVMEEAEKFIARKGKPVDVEQAGNALRVFLDPLNRCSEEPLLVVCFDEANSLGRRIGRQSHTYFSELRHAFHPLKDLPFFSLFVSTGGQSQEVFPDSYTYSSSNRVMLQLPNLFPPITEVSFDDFAVRVPADGSWTLDRLASTHQIAHLGRALFPTRYDNGSSEDRSDIVNFARGRLLGLGYSSLSIPWPETRDDQKLGCLDVRLCLDFRGTHWIDRAEECNQVANHARLCLSATRGFKEMFTVAPSEPLLAEAASLGMTSCGAAKALVSHIRHSHLDAGNRGELVVALLALLARDNALRVLKPPLDPLTVPNLKDNSKYEEDLKEDGAKRVVRVIDFLKMLLPVSCHDQLRNHTPSESLTADASLATLEETFEHAHIWFNHFVKVHDVNGVNKDHLWHYIVRGAAVICTNNSTIHMLIPILFYNRLCQENVSAILIQVKNDPSCNANIKFDTFEGISPFGPEGVFSDKVTSPHPVIRMVFALASDTPAVVFGPPAPSVLSSRQKKKLPPKSRPTPRPKSQSFSNVGPEPAQFVRPKFTAYDILCAGASSKTFRVIDSNDGVVYNELLQCTRNGYDPYTTGFWGDNMADRATARRGMHSDDQNIGGISQISYTERLEDTFKNAHIGFNHSIKVQDFEVASEDYLWHFIVRGAAKCVTIASLSDHHFGPVSCAS